MISYMNISDSLMRDYGISSALPLEKPHFKSYNKSLIWMTIQRDPNLTQNFL